MPEKTYREREIEIWPGNGKMHLPARYRNWESGGLVIPLVSGLGSGIPLQLESGIGNLSQKVQNFLASLRSAFLHKRCLKGAIHSAHLKTKMEF